MINFEKGIPLRVIHIRRDFRPISVCGFWVDDKLEWGRHNCQIFDFGSRIVVKAPGKPDEFIYTHAVRSAQLRDPLDIYCVLQPEKVGSEGKTVAGMAARKGAPRAKQASALTKRLIQHDSKPDKN